MTDLIAVLVPGAWHVPAHYQLLTEKLETAGHPVVTGKLPSVDSANPKQQTTAADADYVRDELLLPQLDAGKKVILILHSYGGCPGAAAAKGLSLSERSAVGKPGGVVGLIFVAAFVANEGDSLLSKLPGQKYDPWVKTNEETGQLDVETPTAVFYADVPEEHRERTALKNLKLQAERALSSPSPPPAWPDAVFDGRRAYIRATQDSCIPAIAQEMMVKFSGVEWNVKEIESSHSPFLSKVDELADMITSFINGWK